ncbi:MAG: hypothetical protein KKC99_12805 [Proteobacteria bacterium]|nr:hypothetical protein [Pseudomonadota bacterium]
MPKDDKKPPFFFDDAGLVNAGLGDGFDMPDAGRTGLDPVEACLGPGIRVGSSKVKAGYYLPRDVLERLDETYLTLRLRKVPVESKSQLVEIALGLLQADLERGKKSMVLREITS